MMTITFWIPTIKAHEVRPGYLELTEILHNQFTLRWVRPIRLGQELRVSPRFPDNCTLAQFFPTATRADAVVITGNIECPGGLKNRLIIINGLEATLTDVLLRVTYRNEIVENHILKPGNPSAILSGYQSALIRSLNYIKLGIEHIASGFDHLLFVFGMLLLVPAGWMLIKVITSFTLAHSITLALATLGYVALPVELAETLIACSILLLGCEIVRSWNGDQSQTIRHPWLLTFIFGLFHGFGFASVLSNTDLPKKEIPLVLLNFNIGVELGQLLFIGIIYSVHLISTCVNRGLILFVKRVSAYTVGSLGAFWTIQTSLIFVAGLDIFTAGN